MTTTIEINSNKTITVTATNMKDLRTKANQATALFDLAIDHFTVCADCFDDGEDFLFVSELRVVRFLQGSDAFIAVDPDTLNHVRVTPERGNNPITGRDDMLMLVIHTR
jgi:hypothetical protein